MRTAPVFVALTDAGAATARHAAEAIGGEVGPFSAEGVRSHFIARRPIVGICAAGILIRILAPLLSDKHDEPPVVAVSDDGASIVPLLGGHRGANDLARAVADALGGHAAITTAGDNRFGVALDAPPPGWTLANPEDAKAVMAALLGGATARLEGNADWLAQSRIPFAAEGEIMLRTTTRMERGDARMLVYHPRRLAVGVGCERGTDPAEAIALVGRTLAEAGFASASVALVASLDLKADEPAVLATAAHLGVSARFFTAQQLEAETPRLKNPSETVFREVGCHGVAEGAALAASGPDSNLVIAKTKSTRAICAIAEAQDVIDAEKVGRARGRLAIIGIGPGSAEWLTPEARHLLTTSDAVVGYSLYLDLVAPLIAEAERFDSPLGSEEARTRQALALAAKGRSVALVSSGDAGIYAMASLVFECLDRTEKTRPSATETAKDVVVMPGLDPGIHSVASTTQGRLFGMDYRVKAGNDDMGGAIALSNGAHRVEILVAPGISAMQAAAARAGAPLGHDFCAISLSDLLTPWEAIEARIRAAAEADFVIAFYNPVSQRRRTQLAEAKRILLAHRRPDTPVVLARNLGRESETVSTIQLSELSIEAVDMLTLVLVGASTTRQVHAGGRVWTYTPRGYERKRPNEMSEPSPLVEEGIVSLSETTGEGLPASASKRPSSALRRSRRADSPTRGEGSR